MRDPVGLSDSSAEVAHSSGVVGPHSSRNT